MIGRVLVCDTAQVASDLRSQLLVEAPELDVEVSTDPFRAVELAASTRPDVVVCSLGLEGLNGVELVRRLTASSPTTAVVSNTPGSNAEVLSSVISAGGRGCVLRDDTGADVAATVRAAATGSLALSPGAGLLLADELTQALTTVERLGAELTDIQGTVARGTSAKADFLANVSHELRTPITVAKGVTYVLRNPNVPEEERTEFLDQLGSSLDKLMSIVDEIIAIAELDRGAFELEPTSVDLAPLIHRSIEDVARTHPTIEIEDSIPARLPVIADGPRIGAVVRELLDNACRFSPPDRPVEIAARAMEEGVVVSITDRGSGLERSVAARSFDEPFTTGEGTLRKEKAGVGAGLHLARQLIVEHGGTLWIDPLPGGGTRASFCIPDRPGHSVEEPSEGGVGAA